MADYEIDLFKTTMSEDNSMLSTIMIIGKHQYLAKTMGNQAGAFYQTMRLAAIESDRAASIREQEATNPDRILKENQTTDYKTLQTAHAHFLANLNFSELEKQVFWG